MVSKFSFSFVTLTSVPFCIDFPTQQNSNFVFGRDVAGEGDNGAKKRSGLGMGPTGVSASSSDTSPDRLSSTSTLKSGSNPPSLKTQSSHSTIESPSRTVLSHEDTVEDETCEIEMSSTHNKRHYPAPNSNSVMHGPIFPRIPIKDALLPIRRGNRGYGFHMKAIKVYSMHSEDFTIQHLVTVSHR